MYYYKANSHVTSSGSRKRTLGTSPVVQWLRLCPSNAGVAGSIPGRGTKTVWPKKKKKKKKNVVRLKASAPPPLHGTTPLTSVQSHSCFP